VQSPADWELDWASPANDRKAPYTEELELLVQGFIDSMGDTEVLRSKLANEGLDEVKEFLKERFRQLDENGLINLDLDSLIH
jgi:hypothetical protein